MRLIESMSLSVVLSLFAVFVSLPTEAEVYTAPDKLEVSVLQKQFENREIRVPVYSKDFPFSAIGVLKGTNRNKEGRKVTFFCSGALVAKDIVLTNAHCVCEDLDCKKYAEDMEFLPNYIKGRSVFASQVVGWWHGEPGSGEDWAIVRLSSPLGEVAGHLGVSSRLDDKTVQSASWQDKFFMVGYPGNFENGETAMLSLGCSVIDTSQSRGWIHDCRTAKGASGGPFLFSRGKEFYVAGLLWGSNPRNKNSYVVPARHFIDRLRKVIDKDLRVPDYTTVQLCNFGSRTKLSASIAYPNASNTSWVSQGHYAVPYQTCLEFPLTESGKKYSGDVYLYADSERGTHWSGEYALRWSSGGFRYTSAADVRGKRSKNYSKFRVKYGRLNHYTFR